MNKVITINLNGNAYQLEEDGYEALRRYLDSASRRLEGNPDRDEIIADIEQSIADKFRALLGVNKTVVIGKEVEAVIEEMGSVQDASAAAEAPAGAQGGSAAGGPGVKDGPGSAAPEGSPSPPRRLFRIREGAKIAGVCNGIAAYFDIDVTIVRIVFGILAFVWGAGVPLYLIMMFVVPVAETPSENAAAHGDPSTAEEFIRRAKAGYYEGMKSFRDRKAYRQWKWQFKREMRQHRSDFKREVHRSAE